MTGHPTFIAPRALAGLGLAAALVTTAAPAAGQTPAVSYPPSRALGDVTAWLQRDTPLLPAQVVDIGPSAVTAITSASPMGQTRGFIADISSEALDPQVLARNGMASWSIPVQIDCERRMAQLGAMTGYRSRDLKSDARVVRAADTTWVDPAKSSPLGSVIRALCDRDFQRPMAGQLKVAANKAQEPAKPALRSAKLPAEPAAAQAAAPQNSAPQGPAPQIAARGPNSPPPAGAPQAPSAEAAAKPKPKPPAGGGAHALQIGASPSLADAQGLLGRFRKKFGADLGGLVTEVEPAQVDGKTVNRVLLSGFASPKEASAFCRTLTATRQACFIRR